MSFQNNLGGLLRTSGILDSVEQAVWSHFLFSFRWFILFIFSLHFKTSPPRLQPFRRELQLFFAFKLQKCFVDYETSPEFPSAWAWAWGWVDNIDDWILISVWSHPWSQMKSSNHDLSVRSSDSGHKLFKLDCVCDGELVVSRQNWCHLRSFQGSWQEQQHFGAWRTGMPIDTADTDSIYSQC